jgi:hypothetical protein
MYSSYSYGQKTKKPLLFVNEQGALLKVSKAKSIEDVYKTANQVQLKYLKKGYLCFSIDSVTQSDSSYTVSVYEGRAYYFDEIKFSEEIKPFLIQKKYLRNPLTVRLYNSLISSYIDFFQQNGYPFVQIEPLSKVNETRVGLYLKINKNDRYFFDTVQAGNIITTHCLEQITGITPGHPYNISLTEHLQNNIDQTGFLKLDSSKIEFSGDHIAKVTPYLSQLRTNSFSGILGISSENGHATITGNVSLSLQNQLKRSETFSINWQKPGKDSQRLIVSADYPYILGSPVGIKANIDIDRQDTTFLSSTYRLGLKTKLNPFGEFCIFASNFNSSGIDSVSTRFANVKSKLIGISYNILKNNFRLNPSRGIDFYAETEFGQHKLLGEEIITGLTYKINYHLNLYIPIPGGSLVFKNQTASVICDSLSQNEMYRIGGLNSLRGFNERSIYSPAYSIFGVEYRWIFEKMSNAFIFYDFCINSSQYNYKQKNKNYSVGAGINLNTRAGTLVITYAIGEESGKSINPKKGIIHIGIVNRF